MKYEVIEGGTRRGGVSMIKCICWCLFSLINVCLFCMTAYYNALYRHFNKIKIDVENDYDMVYIIGSHNCIPKLFKKKKQLSIIKYPNFVIIILLSVFYSQVSVSYLIIITYQTPVSF